MTKNKLKNKLLNIKYCVDNIYLDKYCELIVNCKQRNCDSELAEVHHIVPKNYFKFNKKPIDDSKNNLVKLSVFDHVLAHYYLSLCTSQPYYKFCNSTCLQLMLHRDVNLISEEWLLNNLPLIEEIKIEQRRLNSELQKGLHAGENNSNCKIHKDEADKVKQKLLEGFSVQEISDELKISTNIISEIRRGTHWTCKEDGFKITESRKTLQKRIEQEKYLKIFHDSTKKCKICGKDITQPYISGYIITHNLIGEICSKSCMYKHSIQQSCAKDENFLKNRAKNAVKNRRSYKGENNPMYGKKASPETRRKIREGILASDFNKSKRFSGHKHSQESKEKISKSLKATLKKKKLKNSAR